MGRDYTNFVGKFTSLTKAKIMSRVSWATVAVKVLSKHDPEELPHSNISAGRVFSYKIVPGWLENHEPHSIPNSNSEGLSMIQEIQ